MRVISGAVLGLFLLTNGVSAGEKTMSTESAEIRNLFDFDDETEINQWFAVNDNVMGGLSRGGAQLVEQGCLLFSGSISLENNGGFASIRSAPIDFSLAGYKGVKIRVKGDGRSYQFRLRSDRESDRVAFKQEFQTVADTWVELELPFVSFQPTYRGRVLSNVEPLKAAEITQIGFLIADKKPGSFALIVDEISAYGR